MMNAKEITAALKAGALEHFGADFDKALYQKALAKYKRMCNQYSDFVDFTDETGIEAAISYTIGFYTESKDNVQNTENRQRHQNWRAR